MADYQTGPLIPKWVITVNMSPVVVLSSRQAVDEWMEFHNRNDCWKRYDFFQQRRWSYILDGYDGLQWYGMGTELPFQIALEWVKSCGYEIVEERLSGSWKREPIQNKEWFCVGKDSLDRLLAVYYADYHYYLYRTEKGVHE